MHNSSIIDKVKTINPTVSTDIILKEMVPQNSLANKFNPVPMKHIILFNVFQIIASGILLIVFRQPATTITRTSKIINFLMLFMA